jgi:uncharacterized membrane protein YcfT
MIEFIGVNNIVYFILFIVALVGYKIDRFSRYALQHIDKLQSRVSELEKRVGVEAEVDLE